VVVVLVFVVRATNVQSIHFSLSTTYTHLANKLIVNKFPSTLSHAVTMQKSKLTH
jgi:hypothetical protein